MKNPKNVALDISKKKDIADKFYPLFQKKFSHFSLNVWKVNESEL